MHDTMPRKLQMTRETRLETEQDLGVPIAGQHHVRNTGSDRLSKTAPPADQRDKDYAARDNAHLFQTASEVP
jgi:hypothetical protein